MADVTTKFSPTAKTLLLSNLGFFGTEIPPELEEHLEFLLSYSFEKFAKKNIHLEPGKLEDDMDQMVFAAWMYRNGINGNGKHEMLKSIIRNRQVSNALAEEGSA